MNLRLLMLSVEYEAHEMGPHFVRLARDEQLVHFLDGTQVTNHPHRERPRDCRRKLSQLPLFVPKLFSFLSTSPPPLTHPHASARGSNELPPHFGLQWRPEMKKMTSPSSAPDDFKENIQLTLK